MAKQFTSSLEVVIKFQIDIPVITNEENIQQSSKAASALMIAKLNDALGELKKQYEIAVLSVDEQP